MGRRSGVGLAALCVALLANGTAVAVDRNKANNTSDLSLPGSWTGGVVPGVGDVGVWEATVVGANVANLGADLSWGGIRIANPGGPVTIGAGNTLTLGGSGINMSAATQNLTIASGLTLAGGTKQTWSVGAGRTLTISGALTQAAGGAVAFDTSAGGVINVSSGTPTSILRYGVVNGADVAALDASGNVTGVGAVMVYNVNPDGAGGLPNIAGAQNGFDVVTLNTNATSAFRLSNNLTINAFGTSASTGVIRFNTEWNDGVNPVRDWTIDMASSRTITWTDNNPVYIMTAGTGASNVVFGGSGHTRANGTGTFWLHQSNPNASMIFNNTLGFSQSGGAQQLHKDGVGRVIINSDANNYTGATRITEGTLQIGNGGTVGNLAAASNVINNATLAFSRSNAFTFANNISGTGAVVVNNVGAGEVTLSGANTYTGSTTLSGGFLNLTALDDVGDAAAPLIFNGGGVKHGAVVDISTKTTTFNAGGALVNTDGNNVTYAGAIGGGGAGGLTKSGAGVLTLGGANAYAGMTTVTGGTLRVNGSVAGGATAASGGTLGGTGTINGGATVQSGGTLAPGASVGTLTANTLALDAGSLLTFEFGAGVNDRVVTTATNGLTINGGAVSLFQENSATAFANAGTYNLIQFAGAIQGTGVSALSVANPETGFNYAFGTSGNNVTLTITTTGTVANWVTNGGGSWNTGPNWSTNPTIPNAVGASARFLTQLSSPSTVTLDGGKTVGGVTFASANGYTIAAGSGGTLTFSNTGATAAQLNSTQGSHTISAGVQLNSNLTAHIEAGAQVTLSGAVGGTGGVTMTDPGTLVLGNASNSYGGGTTVSAGTVQFAALGSLGSGNVSLSGGGTLRYGAGNTADISTKTITLGAGGGVIDTGGNDVTLVNPIGNNGAGGFTKAGAGRLTLGAFNNLYSGPTSITGGSLKIDFNESLGDPLVGAGLNLSGGGVLETDTFVSLDNFGVAPLRPVSLGAGGGGFRVGEFGQITVSGVVSGTGSLTKTGAGPLVLSGANTYSGGTTVSEGTLTMANGTALGSGAVNLQGTATLNIATNALPGVLNVSGTPTLQGGSGGGTTNIGAVAGSGTLNLQITAGVFDLVGDLAGFTGVMNISNAGGGTIRWRGSTGSNSISFNLTGVTFNKRGGTAQILLGGLSGDSASVLTGAGGGGTGALEYVIGARNESSEFAGTVTDGIDTPAGGIAVPTHITKVGAGTLTLSGLNTNTGNTRVNAGVLRLTQENVLSDTGNVFIASGATLHLDTGVTTADFINSLYLAGISQPVGEYGAVGSGAQFTTPFITGTGRLLVSTYDLPGDFNNNNVVEATDLNPTWMTAYATNANGDTDQDGDSDGHDFLIWQRFLGQTNPPSPVGAVPEPGCLALAALSAIALASTSRRRRAA